MKTQLKLDIDALAPYFSLFFVLFFLGAIGFGWIHNIVDIAKTTESVGMLALRIVGIFVFPLGVVLGYV